MTDREPDPNPDSPPNEADRGSVESLDRQPTTHDDTPDARNGAVGGADGVVKNQDDTAQ